MSKDLLLLVGGFPSISGDKESLGNHVYQSAHFLSEEAGFKMQVLAFRHGTDTLIEEKDNISIKRIELPPGQDDIFLYENIKLAYSLKKPEISNRRGTVNVWGSHKLI